MPPSPSPDGSTLSVYRQARSIAREGRRIRHELARGRPNEGVQNAAIQRDPAARCPQQSPRRGRIAAPTSARPTSAAPATPSARHAAVPAIAASSARPARHDHGSRRGGGADQALIIGGIYRRQHRRDHDIDNRKTAGRRPPLTGEWTKLDIGPSAQSR